MEQRNVVPRNNIWAFVYEPQKPNELPLNFDIQNPDGSYTKFLTMHARRSPFVMNALNTFYVDVALTPNVISYDQQRKPSYGIEDRNTLRNINPSIFRILFGNPHCIDHSYKNLECAVRKAVLLAMSPLLDPIKESGKFFYTLKETKERLGNRYTVNFVFDSETPGLFDDEAKSKNLTQEIPLGLNQLYKNIPSEIRFPANLFIHTSCAPTDSMLANLNLDWKQKYYGNSIIDWVAPNFPNSRRELKLETLKANDYYTEQVNQALSKLNEAKNSIPDPLFIRISSNIN